MMVAGVMQPYFFPYIGYFQLMARSDVFVLFDDVQHIERGWVGRNRVLQDGASRWLTFPIKKGSRDHLIKEREYLGTAESRRRILSTIQHAYSRAPEFNKIYPLIESLMAFSDTNVANFNANLLTHLAAHLHLGCKIRRASEFNLPSALRGEDRIVSLCQHLGATDYVNPIGGAFLYSEDKFIASSLRLRFLRSDEVVYKQYGAPHVPCLSIVDVLMFNDYESTQQLLKRYTEITPAAAKIAK